MAAVSARCVVEVVGGSKIETRLTRARLSNMGIQYTQYRSHESEYRITPAQVGFLVRFPIRIDVIQLKPGGGREGRREREKERRYSTVDM